MNVEQAPSRSAQETALAEQLRSGAEILRPSIARLVAGGLERGGRIRRLRRVQGTALVVTAVTVAIVTGAVATDVGGVRHDQAEKGVTAASSPAATKAGSASLTTADVIRVASDLLPPDVTARWDPALDGDTGATGLLTDTKGSGQTLVRVAFATPGELPLSCPDYTGTGATCTVERLPDGSTLRLDHNFEYPARPIGDESGAGSPGHGAVLNSAELARPNGLMLYFLASDSAKEKTGKATHPDPVLTLDQLKTIVTDPVWKTLPTPPQDKMGCKTHHKPKDRPPAGPFSRQHTPARTGQCPTE